MYDCREYREAADQVARGGQGQGLVMASRPVYLPPSIRSHQHRLHRTTAGAPGGAGASTPTPPSPLIFFFNPQPPGSPCGYFVVFGFLEGLGGEM